MKMSRREYLDEIREIRRDMQRGCDRSVVHRCRSCGGTTHALHDAAPPECQCEPPEPREGSDDE